MPADALADRKDDLLLTRKEHLLLAVARFSMTTASAWQQFHHEAAARDALLAGARDPVSNSATTDTDAAGTLAHPVSIRLPASSLAPRYLSLSLIHQANKEINRLLGLHTLDRLQRLATDSPDAEPAPLATSHIPAESTTAPADLDVPAESATAAEPGLTAGLQPAKPRLMIPPATVASAPAMASLSPQGAGSASSAACSQAKSGLGPRVRVPSPAKTATAPSSVPHAQHPRRTPQPWMM